MASANKKKPLRKAMSTTGSRAGSGQKKSDDEKQPLIGAAEGKTRLSSSDAQTSSPAASRRISAPSMTRRQTVAAFGHDAELSLPGASRVGSIDVSSRTSSLTAIGSGNPSANRSSASGDLSITNSQSSSKTNLVHPQSQNSSETQLYETLCKSLNRRRQSLQKMNATTASLLMSAAPSLIGASKQQHEQLQMQQRLLIQQQQLVDSQNKSKKSVCFADFVRTSDGEMLGEAEYDYDYDGDDSFDKPEEELLLEEEGLDDEERQRRAIERMKRKKEAATVGRIRKYGYDPLSPPVPKSWADWSMQRRDYQSALAEVLQCQKQPQLSTAAMKGRKESVAFVKEDLLDLHLNKKQNDNNHLLGKKTDAEGKGEGKAAEKKVKEKKGKGASQHHHRHHAQLSDLEIEVLKAYFDHTLFSAARAVAILSDVAAMALLILAIIMPIWIRIPHKVEPNGPEYLYQLTMLENCTILLTRADHSLLADLRDLASDIREAVDHGSMAAISHSASANLDKQQPGGKPPAKLGEPETIETGASNHTFVEGQCERYSFGTWQTFLIGVFVFTTLFGFMAFVLSMCGVCAGSLPKRLYYYHSAAEIVFVSSILALVSVLGFPMGVRYRVDNFSYGHGFYLGVVATICYFLSASLLNLDIFIMCTVPAKDNRDFSRRRKK